MSKTDGGPAFPSPEWSDANGNIAPMEYGMSLRDYFAAKAMQAVCAPSPVTGQYPQPNEYEWCANTAYAMADAMLKARG